MKTWGSRLAKEWHVVTAPPCEARRATSKDVRATVQSKSNSGTAENARARTTPVSVSCACRQSGPEAGRKQVFSGSDGGLSTGVWTGRFTGFSTTSSTLTLWIYSPSIQSRSLLGVPFHCSFTQPNTCIRSLAATAADIPLGHHHGWPVKGAASLWQTLLVRKVFHSKLTAWEIWLPRKSSRVETERG